MNRVKQIACAVGAAGILALSAGAASAAPARAVTDLNVRSGESTAYPVIAVMPAGEAVTVTGCGDGWCYVREYDGFASADYLDGAGVVYGAPPPAYIAPPPAVVVTEPIYRGPAYRFGDRVIRRGIRQFRRELRRERRQDVRQERRMERREVRQERRQDRREARQERRRDRR